MTSRFGSRAKWMWVLRILGLLVPIVYVLGLGFSQSFVELANSMPFYLSPFLVGLISALLLRSWWSVPIVPTMIVVLMLTLVAIMPDDNIDRGGSEIDGLGPVIVVWTLWVIMPSVIGAALGSLLTIGLGSEESVSF